MIGLRSDKNAFTLTIMRILVTLIVIATPHVMVNPKEEKPKQRRYLSKILLHWTFRPNILLEVTNITSETKTKQGERFWEVFKAQTGQDL